MLEVIINVSGYIVYDFFKLCYRNTVHSNDFHSLKLCILPSVYSLCKSQLISHS